MPIRPDSPPRTRRVAHDHRAQEQSSLASHRHHLRMLVRVINGVVEQLQFLRPAGQHDAAPACPAAQCWTPSQQFFQLLWVGTAVNRHASRLTVLWSAQPPPQPPAPPRRHRLILPAGCCAQAGACSGSAPAGGPPRWPHWHQVGPSTAGLVTWQSLSNLAQYARKVSALGWGEPTEGPLSLGPSRRTDRLQHTHSAIGQVNECGPAIVGIRPAPDQITRLESVDDFSGRTRRDVQPVRQLRKPHHTVPPEYPQGPELCRRDVPGSQGLLRSLAQPACDRPEGIRQRLIASCVWPRLRVVILSHGNSVSAVYVVTSH